MVYKKYVTFSFDDGLEQDKRIIEILKKYNLKATFNLNSGLFGKKGQIGRIGDYGLFDLTEKNKVMLKLFKHSNANRISKEEIKQVYEGFEIAAHGYRHDDLKSLSGSELDIAVGKDLELLEAITETPIRGYAYAKGGYSDEAMKYLESKGVLYARTTNTTGGFDFPENPYCFAATAWLIEKNVPELIEKFAVEEPKEKDMLLSFWGHGYEFDFDTENCNWGRFETICKRLSELDNVVFCTNKEAFESQLNR